MSTILLATDGSPSAVKATATAVRLAHATGWRLRVLAVRQMPTYDFGFDDVDVPEPAGAGAVQAEQA